MCSRVIKQFYKRSKLPFRLNYQPLFRQGAWRSEVQTQRAVEIEPFDLWTLCQTVLFFANFEPIFIFFFTWLADRCSITKDQSQTTYMYMYRLFIGLQKGCRKVKTESHSFGNNPNYIQSASFLKLFLSDVPKKNDKSTLMFHSTVREERQRHTLGC